MDQPASQPASQLAGQPASQPAMQPASKQCQQPAHEGGLVDNVRLEQDGLAAFPRFLTPQGKGQDSLQN